MKHLALLTILTFTVTAWAGTVQVYNQTFTGKELNTQVNLGNASFPNTDIASVSGNSLILSPSVNGAGILFRMPIIEAGALGCLEDLVVTVTVDKTALTSDNDFGTAISDGLHGIGAMQGDRNRNWSLDSPDVGNLLFPENFSPSGFLPTTRVVTYIIEAGNIGGTGSQVEVINSSGHSRSYAPLQSLDYQNGFDFLLVGNSTSEAYKVNTVSILVEAQNRDSDCDGIPDEHDDCPNSDLSQTLVIGGCDTGVANALLDDGCTIADLLVACEELARNHGDYVKCVAFVTNELKKDGVISGKDKGRIQSCAAKSSIGK